VQAITGKIVYLLAPAIIHGARGETAISTPQLS